MFSWYNDVGTQTQRHLPRSFSMKFCPSCRETKDENAFSRNCTKPDGLNYRCRVCAKAANASRYLENREAILARNRAWELANPEKRREKERRNYRKNPDHHTARQREWRAANQHRAADIGKRSRIKNVESTLRAVFSGYRKRAEKRALAWCLDFSAFRALVLNTVCAYCGVSPVTDANGIARLGIDRVDNMLGYSADNIVPCCKLCNNMKCALHTQEFLDHVHRIASFNKLQEAI